MGRRLERGDGRGVAAAIAAGTADGATGLALDGHILRAGAGGDGFAGGTAGGPVDWPKSSWP